MSSNFPSSVLSITNLGNGLIMRSARPADAEVLAALVVEAHAADGSPAESAGPWMRDLLERPHPTVTPESVCVVEEVSTGKIASTATLIPQEWMFAGISFDVGRIELCATAPAFRERGLLRRLIENLRRCSHDNGDLMQAITGIPNLYRRFGYEYALEFGGGRTIKAARITTSPPSTCEDFRVRPATLDDVTALQTIDAHAVQRSCVACVRDRDEWLYEISGRSKTSILHSTVLVVERANAGHATPVGYGVVGSGGIPSRSLPGGVAAVRRFELAGGVSWYEATHGFLRQLAGGIGELEPCEEIRLLLGSEHPAYDAARDLLDAAMMPNAWYLHIPDISAFINHVAPVLETRLASSLLTGHTGELTLGFYPRGLKLLFRDGRISAENLPHVATRVADATFPGLTFLQLLVGYRSLSELEHAFPDCRVPRSHAARLLLDALFPRSASWIWPIG
jgi:hypothetical protein